MKALQIILLLLFTFWSGASLVKSQRQTPATEGYVQE